MRRPATSTHAEVSAAARARDGIPDARERDSLAVLGEFFWPALGRDPADLLELAIWDDALDASALESEHLTSRTLRPSGPEPTDERQS